MQQYRRHMSSITWNNQLVNGKFVRILTYKHGKTKGNVNTIPIIKQIRNLLQ